MSAVAAVAGYVWLTITGLLVVLCVAAITVHSFREARADYRARRAPKARVLRLPQPSHCRVVDLSDHRPSA